MDNRSVKIAPSLLSADFTRLGEEIRALEEAGADILHLDIMDGHFVPNLTFGYPIIKQIRQITKLPLDAHFMVTNPASYIEQYTRLGIEYISFHQEATVHHHRLANEIRAGGSKAGIALNPSTPVETV